MKKTKILSIGTMYVDINCLNFPFTKGLFVNRETTGNEYILELGGSALNFAKMTNALDIGTTFIGKVGDDMLGKQLITMLKQNKINPAVIIDPQAQTNIAVHYIHTNGTSIMTSSGNANQQLNYQNTKLMLDMNLKSVDYLYLGGVFKLKQLLLHLSSFAKEAHKNGIKVVLDHGRVNNSVKKEDIMHVQELLPYVDIYLPSMDEFFSVWQVKTPEDGYKKVKKISNTLIAIKNGEQGAIGFENDRSIKVDAFPVKAINTVGAGDSFNAGFIRTFSQNKNLKESLKFACATAALKVSQKDFSLDSINQLLSRSLL
jgi:sugar/nucleoside kinase (ribokinase family)